MKKIFAILAMAGMLAVTVYESSAEKGAVTAVAAEGVSANQSGKKYYVTSEVLHVRSGPGTNYTVIGSLTKGMEVKVFSVRGEKGNRWAKIRFEGLTAYVSRNYLAKK